MSTSKIELVFQDGSGKQQCVGFSRSGGLSGGETIETTNDELSSVFQTAKSNGTSTLSGTGTSIDAAIDNPLSYLDYLVLVEESIEFNTDWSRKESDGATSS